MINPRIRSAISIFNGDYCDVYNLLYDDIHVDGFRGSVAIHIEMRPPRLHRKRIFGAAVVAW